MVFIMGDLVGSPGAAGKYALCVVRGEIIELDYNRVMIRPHTVFQDCHSFDMGVQRLRDHDVINDCINTGAVRELCSSGSRSNASAGSIQDMEVQRCGLV